MAELLTTDEAATYLRLSERKLYELVANGAVPCTKVTGKWLFPKAALDRWVAAGYAGPPAFALCIDAADRRRQSRSAAGVGAARERLADSQACRKAAKPACSGWRAAKSIAAAIHLHRLDGDDDAANVEAVAIRRVCTMRC